MDFASTGQCIPDEPFRQENLFCATVMNVGHGDLDLIYKESTKGHSMRNVLYITLLEYSAGQYFNSTKGICHMKSLLVPIYNDS